MRAAILLALGCLVACGTTRRDQLHRVAKDWCETIRASQVIPVYPLTEDLQPGDLFLVQQPVEQQQVLYDQDGFLPLDYHVGRVAPSAYAAFYERSFPLTEPLPRTWLTADPPWGAAPSAAFPSYSFATTSGGGFELALPVSGVPVGLSLLGAREANGTVSISDARTIGIDVESLLGDVAAWAGTHGDFLANFGKDDAQAGGANYLRVVSRVYLAGKMQVSLRDARSFGGRVDAGAPRPVELVAADSIGDYGKNLGSLNDAIGGEAAGGSARVVAASSRSITLDETFARPLAIGYLGFDLRILPGGALGPPIPTHAVLARGAQPEAGAFFSADEAQYLRAMRRVRGADPTAWGRVLEKLDIEVEEPPADFAAFREVVGTWIQGGPAGLRTAAATRALLDAAAGEP